MSLRILSKKLKHLAGRHNQKTHGRRFEGATSVTHEEMLEMSFDWSELKADDIELQVVTAYCSEGYNEINNTLRGIENPYGLSQDVVTIIDEYAELQHISTVEAISAMDSLVSMQPPLPKPIVVYRGIGQTIGNQAEPGFRFKDEGFSSTSISEENASDFGKGVLTVINVPKGTKGIYTADSSFNDFWDEYEYILPRGLTYEVTAIKNGKIYMDVVEE